MKYNEQALKQHLSKEELKPVYLINGAESFLKQYYSNLIVGKAVTKGFEDFNLHRLEGKDTSIDEISACAEVLPMMSEKSCVLVHDFDISSSSDEQLDELCELLSDLPPSCTVVFWMDTLEISTKKEKVKTALKLIEQNGIAADLQKRDNNDLVKLLTSSAKKRGCELSPSTALSLISTVGNDLNLLQNELDKLCSYSGGVITEEDIDAVCIKTVEATAFKMVDALMSQSFDKAFMMLDALFEQRTEPVMISGALISAYVDMYRAKVAYESADGINMLKTAFPSQYKSSDFRLKNALTRSKKFTKTQLRSSLEELSEADMKLKGSIEDNRLIFEQLMVKLSIL